MVANLPAEGVIATTCAAASPPLEELLFACHWPVLWQANPRQLRRELILRCPACVLFWLEDRRSLAATAQLIAWLRERGNRPYRVAAAYRVAADAESTLRAAGVHSYLPLTDDVATTVMEAIEPLLAIVRQADVVASAAFAAATSDRPRRRDVELDPVRPP